MTRPTKSAIISGERRTAFFVFPVVQRKEFFQPTLSRVGGNEKKPNP